MWSLVEETFNGGFACYVAIMLKVDERFLFRILLMKRYGFKF